MMLRPSKLKKITPTSWVILDNTNNPIHQRYKLCN